MYRSELLGHCIKSTLIQFGNRIFVRKHYYNQGSDFEVLKKCIYDLKILEKKILFTIKYILYSNVVCRSPETL